MENNFKIGTDVVIKATIVADFGDTIHMSVGSDILVKRKDELVEEMESIRNEFKDEKIKTVSAKSA